MLNDSLEPKKTPETTTIFPKDKTKEIFLMCDVFSNIFVTIATKIPPMPPNHP